MHKHVEIYIYPKRFSGWILCEIVESVYERFWAENKKKSTQIRSISFPEWMYTNIISSIKEKLKIEQLLVNLIDSLNHFLHKNLGLQIFYNFLS